jgi:hypothetical protein
MKKNHKTYLLLAAVVIVWGAIGFQIYRYYAPESEEIPVTTSQKFIPEKTEITKDYTITPDYRDPFLGKLYRKPTPKKKKKIIPKPKPQVIFPNITYNGIIQGTGQNTFIISINGKQEIFQKGQVMKGVELLRGSANEITVKYQGETKKYPIVQ